MKPLLFVSLLSLPVVAGAHVVLDVPEATAGQSYRAALRVSHGCEGSPTRQFSVDIPTGVLGAKPMAKPGWRIEVERSKLQKSYQSHGRTVSEDVSRVTWTARTPDDALPNEQFDDFVLMVRLPEQAGRLYWKSTQICDAGRLDWTELPAGKDEKLKSPASVLDVKAAASGAHDHQH